MRARAAALALTAAVLLAGCTRPAWLGGSRPLALHLHKGQVYRFHSVLDDQRELASPVLPQAKKGLRHVEMDLEAEVREVANNRAAMLYRVSNARGSTTDEQGETPLQMRPSFAVNVTVDATTGQILQVLGTGPDAGHNLLDDFLRQTLVLLPASGQAKVGDAWTVTRDIPVPEANKSLSARVTLAGAGSNEKVRTAHLTTALDGPFNLSVTTRTGTASISGRMQVQGQSDADLATGVTLSAREEESVTWHQVIPSATGPLEADFKIHTILKTNRLDK